MSQINTTGILPQQPSQGQAVTPSTQQLIPAALAQQPGQPQAVTPTGQPVAPAPAAPQAQPQQGVQPVAPQIPQQPAPVQQQPLTPAPATPQQPAPTQTATPEQPQQQAPAAPAPVTSMEEAVTRAGLQMDQVSKQVTADGQISDESAQKIAQANGWSPEVVKQFVANQHAANQAQTQLKAIHVQQAHAAVGGEQSATALLTWAAGNLPQQEVDALNDRFAKDSSQATAIFTELHAKHQAAVGAAGSQQMASVTAQAPVTQIAPFANNQELSAAVSDPRFDQVDAYGRPNPKFDANYHAQIQQRMLMTHQAKQAEQQF